jgi:polysaccharide deacetylase 2 family uncharacterized protein YibQ
MAFPEAVPIVAAVTQAPLPTDPPTVPKARARRRVRLMAGVIVVFALTGAGLAIDLEVGGGRHPQLAASLPADAPAPATKPAPEPPPLLYEEAPSPSADAPRTDKPVILGELPALTPAPSPALQAAPELAPEAAPEATPPFWQRNAGAAHLIAGRPMLALVIDDVGVDRKRSARALAELPAAVTMSFLPYAPEVARQAQDARTRGHEIIVHVPMEPDNSSIDPGPHALRVSAAPDALLRDFDWDLAQFDGYVGINNHMGSRFTRDAEGMRAILTVLKARGLLFLDSRTTGQTVGPRIARDLGLPFLERDVFLDNVASAPAIEAQLAVFERLARHDGYAIAIGHPREETLDVLIPWAQSIEARGFTLVPLSAVMRAKLAAEHGPNARAEQGRG